MPGWGDRPGGPAPNAGLPRRRRGRRAQRPHGDALCAGREGPREDRPRSRASRGARRPDCGGRGALRRRQLAPADGLLRRGGALLQDGGQARGGHGRLHEPGGLPAVGGHRAVRGRRAEGGSGGDERGPSLLGGGRLPALAQGGDADDAREAAPGPARGGRRRGERGAGGGRGAGQQAQRRRAQGCRSGRGVARGGDEGGGGRREGRHGKSGAGVRGPRLQPRLPRQVLLRQRPVRSGAGQTHFQRGWGPVGCRGGCPLRCQGTPGDATG
mmetsp:Transcript_70200/g.199029  ORF Transcript_70200/g.199029 Transcript_70200/m.199029 type:complete len:270 (+) Transcript_70200:115-924(+)